MRPLLIRRHTLTVARGRWVWPDRLFSCTDTGWTWPGVAQYLPPLAPRLAPHNPANLRPGAPRCGPVSSGASASRARLRHPGNQARDCPRPKVATPGRDRPTLSTAAPGTPPALPVPRWPSAARRTRRLHSTARGRNPGGRPTSTHSRTAASRSPRTAGTARRAPAHQDPPVHRNQTTCPVHDATPAGRPCRPIASSREDPSAIAE